MEEDAHAYFPQFEDAPVGGVELRKRSGAFFGGILRQLFPQLRKSN